MTESKRDAFLEALLEPVLIASSYMGDDGRPLAELTAPRRLREGVPFELRRCPYPHSRLGKPMNVSALRILSLGMKPCINDTIRLRRAFLRRESRESFDLASFWRFARALDSIPAYLVRRQRDPIDPGALPTRVATMFKAAQGLHLAPEILIFDSAPLSTPVGVESLMELIEARGLFLDDGRACAGPPHMVEAFVRAAIEGVGDDMGDDGIFDLLGDPDAAGLFAYSDAVSDVFIAKARYEAEARLELRRELPRIGSPELQEIAEGAQARFGFYRDRSVAQLRAALELLDALVALPPRQPPPTIEPPAEFMELVALRNVRRDPVIVERCARWLWQSLAGEDAWLQVLQQLQQRVRAALGRGETADDLSSRDFEGTGYAPREVLSQFLELEVAHREGVRVVRAGASAASFAS